MIQPERGILTYPLELAAGNVTAHTYVQKFGRSAAGVLNTEVGVAEGGIFYMPTTATQMRVKAGGNAADTAAGAGAREITIVGLDASGLSISETIATAGESASAATTQSFLRVHRAYVSAAGAYPTTGLSTTGTNQAAVTIEIAAGSQDVITIPQYEGQTVYGGYHIPPNKYAYMLSAEMAVASGKSATLRLYQREAFLTTSAPTQAQRRMLIFDGLTGLFRYEPHIPLQFTPETDLWWTFEAAANGTQCSVVFELLLVDAS